jgi:Ras-related protein Rab-23
MNDTEDRYIFKITVIGDGEVGKTSLIKKFTKGSFKEDYIKTIGAQFSKYDKNIDNDEITLFLWDIAGQDEFHFLRPSFFKESKAAIIVYSLEENKLGRESFKNITNWHDDIKQFCGDIPILVFGNKVDLVDEESLDEANILKLVKKRKFLGYYRTSAKTGKGVTSAFHAIITELHNKYKKK